MRIGILVDDAIDPHPTGVPVAVRGLVESLLKTDREDRFVLIHSGDSSANSWSEPLASHGNCEWARIPVSRRLRDRFLWPLVGWPHVEFWVGPLDVLHVTSNLTKVPSKCPQVVTVHDMFPELQPSRFRWTGRVFRQTLLRQLENDSSLIATPSEATVNDLLAIVPVGSHRTFVVPWGAPAVGSTDRESPAGPIGMEEDHPFILFLGRVHPRKNVDGLVKAYALFRRNSSHNHKLVIAGSWGWQTEKVKKLVKSLGVERDVSLLGYITEQEKWRLLREADLFVYPSRCEGFGFPLLEAMACGTPIASSNASSIPEVAGDASLYFNPEDPEDISRTLATALENETTREELRRRGIRRLREFDWQTTALRYLDVYRRAITLASPNPTRDDG